jgi:hypothetical protein
VQINTYWHHLDGPNWIFKANSISISGSYIYTIGSDKDSQFKISLSTDNGETWSAQPRNNDPANFISSSVNYPGDAYYTSPNNNVFSTTNAGYTWDAPTNTPPENLNFTTCAANPFNYQKALVGCEYSESSGNNLWKTINHGQDWDAVDIPDYWIVNEAAWSGVDENTFYVGFNGVEDDCLYRFTNGGNNYTGITPPNYYISDIRQVAVMAQGSMDAIVVIGFSDHWKILYSTNNGSNWTEVLTPPGFQNTTTYSDHIRDVAIMKIQNSIPVFLMATDVGIYEYESNATWTHIYDNAGDNNVYSVAIRSPQSNPEIFAGTLHSILSIDESHNFVRENGAMYIADLKSTWVSWGSQAYGYTLNKKTGAIFKANLDFTHFTYAEDALVIGADTIVANISGADGEYDGLDLVGYQDRTSGDYKVIASSVNEEGVGKVIRFNGSDWREGSVPGNAPLVKLGAIIEGTTSSFYGITASGDVYSSSDGDSWSFAGMIKSDMVNDILVTGITSLAVAAIGQDVIGKVIFSTDGGSNWSACQVGLGSVTQVNKLTRGNDGYYYAATDVGVFKNANIYSETSPWVLKDEALPAGSYTDIMPGSQMYKLVDYPESYSNPYPYDWSMVVYAVKSGANRDGFYISADSARSWVEDSFIPLGGDVHIRRISDFNIIAPNAYPQTGILAATDRGLLYHPHNVVNGIYKALEENLNVYWGPGLILVNGTVFTEPNFTTLWNYPTLQVDQNTIIKFTYKFNLGQEAPSLIEIKGNLVRSAGDDSPDPEYLTKFMSSRHSENDPFYNDWGGIKAIPYEDPKMGMYYDTVMMRYCKIEGAENGIYTENCDTLGISHSIFTGINENGVVVNNTELPEEPVVQFIVEISDCDFLGCLKAIHMSAVGVLGECDFAPWNGTTDPENPRNVWNIIKPNGVDPYIIPHPSPVGVWPCDFEYYTKAFVLYNEISGCLSGIYCSGEFPSNIIGNKLNQIKEYGIHVTNDAASVIYGDTIGLNSQDSVDYDGIFSDRTFFVQIAKNNITKCRRSGINVSDRSYTYCYENFVHENRLASLYIKDSSPRVWPAGDDELPNTFVNSQIGCYLLRTDQGQPTQPGILKNRIKQYAKAGVYVIENCWPILGVMPPGDTIGLGYNSIPEGDGDDKWNFYWDYELYPPEDKIWAYKNWWGPNGIYIYPADDVYYDPWLTYDPYPGFLPKIAVQNEPLPQNLAITSTYPNPFNPRTQFEFYLPSPGKVTAKVYDILGRHVRTLVNHSMEAGVHTGIWDGNNEMGTPVGSGVYFLQVQSADQSSSKKITLLK